VGRLSLIFIYLMILTSSCAQQNIKVEWIEDKEVYLDTGKLQQFLSKGKLQIQSSSAHWSRSKTGQTIAFNWPTISTTSPIQWVQSAAKDHQNLKGLEARGNWDIAVLKRERRRSLMKFMRKHKISYLDFEVSEKGLSVDLIILFKFLKPHLPKFPGINWIDEERPVELVFEVKPVLSPRGFELTFHSVKLDQANLKLLFQTFFGSSAKRAFDSLPIQFQELEVNFSKNKIDLLLKI